MERWNPATTHEALRSKARDPNKTSMRLCFQRIVFLSLLIYCGLPLTSEASDALAQKALQKKHAGAEATSG